MKLFSTPNIKISLEKAQTLFENPKINNKFDFLINLIKDFFCYIPRSMERKLFIKQLSREIKSISKDDSQGKFEIIKKIITLISTSNYPISKIENKFKLKQKLIDNENALKKTLIDKENTIKQQVQLLIDKENKIKQQAHVIFENYQNDIEVIEKYKQKRNELHTQNIFLQKKVADLNNTINAKFSPVLGTMNTNIHLALIAIKILFTGHIGYQLYINHYQNHFYR